MSIVKVLYEDNHIIAVVKPAGVLTQGDKSGDISLFDMVKDYIRIKKGKGSLLEPGNACPAGNSHPSGRSPARSGGVVSSGVFLGLVHRLDRPVQGIVLFAKTSKGASRLSEQFRNHEIEKIYHAIVLGKPKQNKGMLVDYLEKIKTQSSKFKTKVQNSKVNESGGKEAVLYYEVVPMPEASRMLGGEAAGIKSGKYSLLKIKLETGKFHQIRGQLSAAGFPILGDVKYGHPSPHQGEASEWQAKNIIALCATAISFKTAASNEQINLKIDIPEEWKTLIEN
ncbi:MAG: RluA family pseudouridine synthase [Patescibacteria group bacterium]